MMHLTFTYLDNAADAMVEKIAKYAGVRLQQFCIINWYKHDYPFPLA